MVREKPIRRGQLPKMGGLDSLQRGRGVDTPIHTTVEYSKNMTITDKKMIFIILICVDLVQSKKTLTKKLERHPWNLFLCIYC